MCRVATPFYQLPAYHVYSFLRNLLYLILLCNRIRKLVAAGKYRKCESILAKAMGTFPHAPQPHNLFGIVFEKEGDHIQAMKHFRAAWALDPTYLPARTNMDQIDKLLARQVGVENV